MSGFSLTAQLMLNISDFTTKLNQASAKLISTTSRWKDTTKIEKSLRGASRVLIDGASELNNRYKDVNKQLSKHSLGLKDVARITQGIVISQFFYGVTNAIQDATNALMDFNEQLDYSEVTYTALFGSSNLAKGYLESLKEQAVDTMFSFEDLTEVSKKLLAYGIDYKNLGYITEGLTNLGAMSGDAAALDRIALALGQIQTTGYLAATEMRQLANAYVPIYKIVQDTFNLTGKQMSKVGDLRLPASQVINAVIDYANANFGAVGDAAMLTITGLKNKIVDSVKVMGSEMLKPFTVFFKSFLKMVSDTLAEAEAAYAAGGAGGLFEYFVPNENTQQRIRQFLANIQNAVSSLINLVRAVWPVISALAAGFVDAFNIIAPIIISVGNILTSLISVITADAQAVRILAGVLVACAAAWVLFKAKALAAMVVTVVTKVVTGLANAFLMLAAAMAVHPFLTAAGLIAAALIGVAVASGDAKNKISSFFDSLSGKNGKSSNEVLQLNEAIKETSADSETFNERLSDTSEALDDVEDSAKKARKGLLSFDEVFKLNDDKDEATGVDTSGLDDMLSGLDSLGTSLLPEIPDFSDFSTKFVENLTGDLWKALQRIMTGGIAGALIGGLAGFVIGGLVTGTLAGALGGAKIGAAIGGIAGGAFAAFWEESYNKIEEGLKKIASYGAIGGMIGGLVGFVLGAFITGNVKDTIAFARKGAALGSLIGGGLGTFIAASEGALGDAIARITIAASTGGIIGSLFGFILGAFLTKNLSGALGGAKLGATIGALVYGASEGFFGDAEASLTDSISNMFANIQAASYGALIGGLVGLVVGAVIGAFAGGVGALPGARLGATIGSMAGGLIGTIVKALSEQDVGAKIGDWLSGIGDSIGAGAAAAGEWFAGLTDSISAWYDSTIESIYNWATETRESISTWYNDTKTSFSNWCTGVINDISTWYTGTKEKVSTWVTETEERISTWYTNTKESVSTWVSETEESISTWYTNTKESVSNWVSETEESISTWYTNTKESISTWATETAESVSVWYTNTKDSISTWATETKEGIATWYTGTKEKISTWATETKSKVSTWSSETKASLSTWASETSVKLSTWYNNTKTGMSNWVVSMKSSLGTWWNNLWNPSTWKSGWDSIKSWFSDLFSNIRNWFSSLKDSISNWWNNLWSDKSANVRYSAYGGNSSSFNLSGHASGGIFNREHVARFAEGNKAEAIIPLENEAGMQPFVDAVSNGITASLAPILAVASGPSTDTRTPVYVGTLIADNKGLKELERKLKIIRVNEEKRGN